MINSLRWVIFGFLSASLTHCSYNVRGSGNDVLEEIGIKSIYVAPVRNDTYTSGINNVVYNELLRIIASNRQVRLTRTEENADAVLQGTIKVAEYVTAARTTANTLDTSEAKGNADISVATLYNASLQCQFVLQKTKPDLIASQDTTVPSGLAKKAWSGSFYRTKAFPAANQLGTPGTTSALINESEFQRALKDLAATMMDEVHESMLSLF